MSNCREHEGLVRSRVVFLSIDPTRSSAGWRPSDIEAVLERCLTTRGYISCHTVRYDRLSSPISTQASRRACPPAICNQIQSRRTLREAGDEDRRGSSGRVDGRTLL